MASRQGLKLFYLAVTIDAPERRQWNGFPSGIETTYESVFPFMPDGVASGMASRQGLKPGISHHQNGTIQVASGMASRQGLKLSNMLFFA